MSEFKVKVSEHQLSDRSEVYDVEFAGQHWHAVSKSDADALADKIVEVFSQHTVDTVVRSFD